MKKLILSVFGVIIAVTALAQVTTSGINGHISDASDNPIIGATIVATHTASGTEYGTVADGRGNYRLLNLRPGGPYTVRVQMLGFSTIELTGINLTLADIYSLNTTMHEGAVGMDAIVVTVDRNNNMDSERAGAITSVNSKGISMTPSVSRSINDVMRLTPQSTSTSNGMGIGGGNYRQSSVTVDGAAFNNSFGIGQNLPASGSPISLDALEQISVSITPFDVRQSGFTGGAINAVTRSGDNEFKGSVYTYLTNEKFRGNKIKDGEFDKDKAKNNVYGLSFGGPIIKNKLFFFINGELDQEQTPGPAARASLNAGDPLSGNFHRPTVAQMDMFSKHVFDKYGYETGPYQNYSIKTPGYKMLARVDWNINANHKLNVRYSNTHSKYNSSISSSTSPLNASTIYANSKKGRTSTNSMYFKNSRFYQEQNFMSVAAELNSIFGNVTNTFRVTYSHQDEPRSWDGSQFPTVDILGDDRLPLVALGLDPFTFGNLRDVKTFIVTDEVNWGIGINNFTVGAQYEFNRTKNGYMPAGSGYYVYKSWDDFVNDARPTAFAISHSNTPGFKQAFPSFDYEQFSFYIQDRIDITSNFKLTPGIRLELPIYPSLKDNNNPNFGKLEFKDGKKYTTDQMPKTRLTVSPRIGFNWDITKDRKYVLRGGTGVFTGRIPFVWIVSTVGNSNMLQTVYSRDVVLHADNIPGFHANTKDILEDFYNGTFSFDPANAPIPQNPTIMDKNLKMPSTWKSSLGFDVKLPGGILATLEGIYNRDVNPVVVSNVGLKDPTIDGLTMSANDKRDKYNGYYNKIGNPLTGRDVIPYLIENGGPKGWYYSVTAKLEKNFNFGLSAMVAYTHSDARSTSDGIGDQIASVYNVNTASVNGVNKHDLGYGSYVAPDRFIASISYRKEYARHFATTVSLFYQGSQLGYQKGTSRSYTRFSYTYTGNVVGDRGGSNLIYVPKTKDELTFKDSKYDNGTKIYLAADQKEDFWNFVNQDKYLKSRKGKYVERNGAKMPWRSTFDVKILQDFFIDVNGKRNTLQVGLDIMNAANLLNKNWGNVKQVNNTGILAYNSDGTYSFSRDDNDVLKSTFSRYQRFASTYYMQLSLRYIFN